MIKSGQPASLANYNKYYDDIFDVLNPIDDVNEDYLIFDKNKPTEYNNLLESINESEKNKQNDVSYQS